MKRQTDIPRVLAALGIQSTADSIELWANCPFHAEKTGSWSIVCDPGSTKHGLHNCFGCGASGDVVSLVMDLVGITFSGAMGWLESNHLFLDEPPPATDVELVVTRPASKKEFKLPGEVILGPLDSWVTPPRRYAAERGITAAQVATWGIGYAVEGRLGGRLVFPTRDEQGQLLSYTARTFVGAERRYLTPNENPNKGPVEGSIPGGLFGEIGWVPREQRKSSTIVVCEGAINGLACERVGVRNFAALGGSNLDKTQCTKLSQFAALVVAVDSDTAGDKATNQLEVLTRYCKIDRVEFPKGVDAAKADPRDLKRWIWESRARARSAPC